MSITPAIEHVPVLIIGGGVVGLTASLFLAAHDVRALLVERHPGTSIHPRARGVNGRTMELMRELGLEEAVRAAGAKLAPALGIYSGTTLVQVLRDRGDGDWVTRRLRRRGGMIGLPRRNSPTSGCRCTQEDLEPLLLEAARARGVDARFFTEHAAFEQDDWGVTSTLRDRKTGEERKVRADYLIAADGARSPSRERLGAAWTGRGGLSDQLNLYFRADLASLVQGREFSLCLVESPGLRGLLASINNADLWVLHVSYRPEDGERPEDFPEERCIALIRQAVGIPDLAVDLKGALPWQSTVRVAESYRHRRVFLAGDAAHVMPPWGGFGANTGIQDSHNLAWKLAEVLAGRAGSALLDTYDAERRPVGRTVANIAGDMNDERGLIRVRPWLPMMWSMRRVFAYFTMGYGYSSAAVMLEPGAPPGPGSRDLRGRPGTRAPHLWLRRDGRQISTLDLFGRAFVLLTGARGDAWADAGARIARRREMDLSSFRIGRDIEDHTRRWATAYGVTETGACFIRPDGIVAWRSRCGAPSPDVVLNAVFDRVLGARERSEPARAPASVAT